MIKIDVLIERLNTFLKEKSLEIVDEDIGDFIPLYKEVLKSIWKEKSVLKRDLIYEDFLKYTANYVDIKNLVETFEDYIADLNAKYPPFVSIEEIYNFALKEYDFFIGKYLKNEIVGADIFYRIVKYLKTIVEKNKNSVLSYIFLNTENYNYQIYHSINSTIIALTGGMELKLDEDNLNDLGIAGLLHDIGMLKIPDHILTKEEKLTDEEYTLIKTHPITSFKYVEENFSFKENILEAILQHHEQQDGKGYPKRMRGEKINLLSKIISISDAFESQISRRSYRRSKSGYMAMREVLSSNNNMFDTEVLKAFLRSLSIYPPGTLVQLNNNAIGVVVQVNNEFPLRPKIKMLVDEFGDVTAKEIIKDLNIDLGLFITRVVNKSDYVKK